MKKLLLSFCFVVSAFLGAKAQGGGPLFTAPIGVQAYTYRDSWEKGVVPVLDTLKALGITEVEGPGPGIVTPEEFKKLANERGISIPSIGAGYDAVQHDI